MRNAVVSADGERVHQHSLTYVTLGAAARPRPYLKQRVVSTQGALYSRYGRKKEQRAYDASVHVYIY